MRKISVSDVTLKQKNAAQLTFREKLDLVKLLDKLYVDCIEVAPLTNHKADELCIKSMAQSIEHAVFAVPVGLEEGSVERCANALKEAKKPRLQVECPVSSVQIEYLYHLKPKAAVDKICQTILCCRKFCDDVEFVAMDATRSESAFLYETIQRAAQAGATTVTVNDDAGNMTPEEYRTFIEGLKENVPAIKEEKITLGVCCCNRLSLADICTITGVVSGANVVKASIFPDQSASVVNILKILSVKKDCYDVETGIRNVEIKRLVGQAERIFTQIKSKNSPFDDGVRDARSDSIFTSDDSIEAIAKEAVHLGYSLNDEDLKKTYETFCTVASKKKEVSSKELDAIIASSAMQVPPTYVIKEYIINSGNTITATCHMVLAKDGEKMESVSIGDGPVDASFLAIEQITGHHYELDDFQIQSVTEGRTAMGETIVKLRANGKVYSGRGISTDVIGSSIHAYVNALNKIVYEEDNH